MGPVSGLLIWCDSLTQVWGPKKFARVHFGSPKNFALVQFHLYISYKYELNITDLPMGSTSGLSLGHSLSNSGPFGSSEKGPVFLV